MNTTVPGTMHTGKQAMLTRPVLVSTREERLHTFNRTLHGYRRIHVLTQHWL